VSDIVEVGEHENGKQIEMHRQQPLWATLTEVRTVGFRWIPRPSTQHALPLVADELSMAAVGIGGAAMHHWEFRAEESATSEITFDYCQPWVKAAATTRTLSDSVRVV
jgi:predicted secreted protein